MSLVLTIMKQQCSQTYATDTLSLCAVRKKYHLAGPLQTWVLLFKVSDQHRIPWHCFDTIWSNLPTADDETEAHVLANKQVKKTYYVSGDVLGPRETG